MFGKFIDQTFNAVQLSRVRTPWNLFTT